MMKHEIIYERDIHKSYMKIPSLTESNFDEKIILSKPISGALSVKKHFTEREGWYWYDISGKQALDSYCKVDTFSADMFERLMIQMLHLLEELEWNLIEVGCLCLYPELIFINAIEQDFLFTLYPSTEQDIFQSLQEFMEYVLTKLDHRDIEGVHKVYRLYEVILKGDYTLVDLRNIIIERTIEEKEAERKEMQDEDIFREVKLETEKEETAFEKKIVELYEKVIAWIEKIKQQNKKSLPQIVYPEEEDLEDKSITIHPTVCISAIDKPSDGRLMYDGVEHFSDCELGQCVCVVGKSNGVMLQIRRDTVSQFHAKIEWKDDGYYIEDMNSTNGTFVNEEMLNYKESRKLKVGDSVRFADVKYRFI